MKVILIEEPRFAELCELIDKGKLELKDRLGDSPEDRVKKFVIDEAFRNFNYHLVRWCQSHGASCVPK